MMMRRLCISCVLPLMLLSAVACADPTPEAYRLDAVSGDLTANVTTEDSMMVRVYHLPLEQIYGRHWQTKRISYDIRYFEGRVYFGHGSTDSPVGTKVVYFDPESQAFAVERDARGREVEIPEEILDRFRVFDGALYINSRDPVRDGTHFIRRAPDGSWTSRVVGPPAHNYDVYRHAGRYFISHPSHRGDFPGVLVSSDGRRFSSLDGSGHHQGPYTPYFEFIEIGDGLYATTIGSRMTTVDGVSVTSGQPWMVRFDAGAGGAGDEVSIVPVAQDPSDLVGGLIDEPMSPAQLRRAVRFGGATYALNGSAQIVRLADSGSLHASIIDIELAEGAYIADLAADDLRLLALIVQRLEGGSSRMEIREVGESGTTVVSADVPGVPTALEIGSQALYAGGHDGLLIEIAY
jgi:hypothetical protein